MANQMIALQARAPQTNPLGGMVQQNAQMMNMMTQQAAAQRQAQQAAQAMEIARAQEGRAAALAGPQMSEAQSKAQKAQVEYQDTVLNNFRSHLQVLAPGDLAGATALREAAIAALPGVAQYMPSAELMANDPATRQRMLATAEQWTTKNIPQAQAEVGYTPGGGAVEIRTGGAQPGMAGSGAYELEGFGLAPKSAAPAAPSGAIPPPPKLADTPAPAQPNGRADALHMAHDFLTANPIAYNPAEGAQAAPAALTMETAPQIIEAARRTGSIDVAHAQQLRQLVGPENEQALADWMKQNSVSIAQGGEAAPAAFQRAQYVPTGRQFVGKDPMQSPAPGSVLVPNTTIRGQAEAQGMGSGTADVVIKPAVKAGELRVARIEKLRENIPQAFGQTQTVVADLRQRIAAIDDFLRHPHRNRVIGSVEGRVPESLMDESRADVIALWNTIKNNSVLEQLIRDRQQTETGASPMGMVSDRDMALAASAANRLTRTGSEPAQEAEMKRLRRVLYDTLDRAVKTYNSTYREVQGDEPQFRLAMPPVNPAYRTKPAAQQTQGASSGWGRATVVGN